jgi:apolipoprotein D and lipocalin family protein
MKNKQILAASAAAAGLAAVAMIVRSKNNRLETVGHVDLEKYLGKWYEIARFPHSFEHGCTCSVAEYSLNEDGTIKILNSCMKHGRFDIAEGKASVTDKKTNAKLSVEFVRPFSGKYWIIALAHDYSYAMVGHPNRKYLWILNRKSQMDEQTYNYLLVQAASKGFDVRNLVKTEQDCGR